MDWQQCVSWSRTGGSHPRQPLPRIPHFIRHRIPQAQHRSRVAGCGVCGSRRVTSRCSGGHVIVWPITCAGRPMASACIRPMAQPKAVKEWRMLPPWSRQGMAGRGCRCQVAHRGSWLDLPPSSLSWTLRSDRPRPAIRSPRIRDTIAQDPRYDSPGPTIRSPKTGGTIAQDPRYDRPRPAVRSPKTREPQCRVPADSCLPEILITNQIRELCRLTLLPVGAGSVASS